MYKVVYSETTGYYENVPVLLRSFYTVQCKCNETFINILLNEDMKNHEYFVI